LNNILITGASGFVGQGLVTKLSEDKNNQVFAMHRNVHPYVNSPTNVSRLYGDMLDYDSLCNIISKNEINTVYHMAANAIVRSCANDPRSAYSNNVMGTVNLLEAIRTCGKSNIKSIVVSTSDKAFGHADPPYDENTPLKPKYTYEATKACQDIVCQNFWHNYELPIKIARCSNVYGPGDPNTSRLIPNTIKLLLANKSPEIYREVAYYKREFVYISDIVSAMETIANKGANGEAYCVGGTAPMDILTIVLILCSKINPEIPVKYIDKPILFKEIESQFINASKLNKLGWYPKVKIDEGLENTINWYRKKLDV
jgi:CDP-glucose 4,6-dehydratase